MDIERLSNHSDAVLEMSTQIATSSEEQSSVAEEITRNLDKVRHEASRVEGVRQRGGRRHHRPRGNRQRTRSGADRPADLTTPAGHRPDGPAMSSQALGTRETARPTLTA